MKQSEKSQPTMAPDIDQVKEDVLAQTRDLASLIAALVAGLGAGARSGGGDR